MKCLNNKDLQLLVSAIGDLHADFDARTLPERALAAVSKIIAADSVVFTEVSFGGVYTGVAWDNAEALSSADMEIFGAYLHEHPLFTAFIVERRTETLKITDLVSHREFHRTNIYNELYRRLKIANQLIAPLLISDDSFIACSINTSQADFTECDRTGLTLFAPHLVNAIRNALAYERLSSALETEACGIIAVSSKGKPVFVSEFARRLLERYFAGEKRAADTLPETLSTWIKQANATLKTNDFSPPPEPLKIEIKKGVLSIRLMYNQTTRERTFLLEEKKFSRRRCLKS